MPYNPITRNFNLGFTRKNAQRVGVTGRRVGGLTNYLSPTTMRHAVNNLDYSTLGQNQAEPEAVAALGMDAMDTEKDATAAMDALKGDAVKSESSAQGAAIGGGLQSTTPGALESTSTGELESGTQAVESNDSKVGKALAEIASSRAKGAATSGLVASLVSGAPTIGKALSIGGKTAAASLTNPLTLALTATDYLGGALVDTVNQNAYQNAIEEATRDLDISDPEQMGRAISAVNDVPENYGSLHNAVYRGAMSLFGLEDENARYSRLSDDPMFSELRSQPLELAYTMEHPPTVPRSKVSGIFGGFAPAANSIEQGFGGYLDNDMTSPSTAFGFSESQQEADNPGFNSSDYGGSSGAGGASESGPSGGVGIGGYADNDAVNASTDPGFSEAQQEADNPGTNGPVGPDSDGDDSIICTELHRQGLMTDRERTVSRRDAVTRLSATTLRGYHVWARPVVRWMKRSTRATTFWRWVWEHRNNDVRRIRSKDRKSLQAWFKRDWLGWALRVGFEAFSWSVGVCCVVDPVNSALSRDRPCQSRNKTKCATG